MPTSISRVKAFIASGRLMVMIAMWPCFSYWKVDGSSSATAQIRFFGSMPVSLARFRPRILALISSVISG